MEKQPNALGSLFESAGDYLETRVDLLKLKTVDKSSDVISSVVSSMLIALIITFGIFILNIGISIWLGSVLGEIWYGFFIVAGFYLLLAVLLYIFKDKWLKGPINDFIVKKILN
jgi:phosphoglycerol transferase MdoB-like AlkP superfamily enzyme